MIRLHDDDGLAAQGGIFLLFADTKKALRSRNSHWMALSAVAEHSGSEMTSPNMPPRYAFPFPFEDLRAFHLLRASCHACAHKAIMPNVMLLQGRPGYSG